MDKKKKKISTDKITNKITWRKPSGLHYSWKWVEAGSVVVLFGGYGNKLLSSLGDVISTLDDLLGDQLHVGSGAALQRRRFLTLILQAVCTGC